MRKGQFMAGISTGIGGTLKRGEFRGNAGEYFGIWIVNILLTIVTLGIYSAWAKVRRMRYFRGNTVLDGYAFDYHARGGQIFLGRVIVFIVLAMVNVLANAFPLVAPFASLIFLVALPFFIVRSLKFNARVTSYCNVRFDFTGKAWGAFTSIILGSILSALTLGILAPLASRWSSRYVFNHFRYGDRPFSSDPKLGALYRSLVPPALVFIIGLAILVVVTAIVAVPIYRQYAMIGDDSGEQHYRMVITFILILYAILIPFLLVYAVAALIYRAAVRNVVFNAALFDNRHPLFSDLSRFGYFWIILSNTVVTLLTLGLMRPWAAVREQRYLVTHTGIVPQGDIGEIMAAIQASGSAISSEYMDLEGLDFGF
jgi:uncharacterized membrane protein YjgN (DUF898 family)